MSPHYEKGASSLSLPAHISLGPREFIFTVNTEQYTKIHKKNISTKYYTKFFALTNFPFDVGSANVFNSEVPQYFWTTPYKINSSKSLVTTFTFELSQAPVGGWCDVRKSHKRYYKH